MPPKHLARSFVLTFIGLALAAGCGDSTDDDPSNACVPGTPQPCIGDGACVGGQACLADGKGYGVCACSSGAEDAATGLGTGGTGGVGSGTGGSAGSGALSGTGGVTAAGTGPLDASSDDATSDAADSTPPNGGGATNDAAVDAPVEASQGGDDSGAADASDSGDAGVSEEACLGATDLEIGCDYPWAANECGKFSNNCIEISGFSAVVDEPCVSQCMMDEINVIADVSDAGAPRPVKACTDCFAELITCSAELCARECIINASGDNCTNCVAAECGPEFWVCSGLSTSDAECNVLSGG